MCYGYFLLCIFFLPKRCVLTFKNNIVIYMCVCVCVCVCIHIYIYIVKVKLKLLSHVRLFATPWTVAYQAPPSVGFSRQEYWSGLPFPSPGDLPNPGIEPGSPALQADALPSEPPGNLYVLAESL